MMSDIPIHRPEHTGLYIFLASQSPYRVFPTPLDTRCPSYSMQWRFVQAYLAIVEFSDADA